MYDISILTIAICNLLLFPDFFTKILYINISTKFDNVVQNNSCNHQFYDISVSHGEGYNVERCRLVQLINKNFCRF